MADRPNEASGEVPSFPRDRYSDPETALGGADAVPDTNYVPREEPVDARKGAESGVTARVPAGGGRSATWAVIAFLVIGAVLVYLLGFGR